MGVEEPKSGIYSATEQDSRYFLTIVYMLQFFLLYYVNACYYVHSYDSGLGIMYTVMIVDWVFMY